LNHYGETRRGKDICHSCIVTSLPTYSDMSGTWYYKILPINLGGAKGFACTTHWPFVGNVGQQSHPNPGGETVLLIFERYLSECFQGYDNIRWHI